jgi:hypothetical protein
VIENVFKHALIITFFVFVMMLVEDFIDSISKLRMSEIIKSGPWRQYTLASLPGSTPGCLGAFLNVSLYVHGMISVIYNLLRPGRAQHAAAIILKFKGFYVDKAF